MSGGSMDYAYAKINIAEEELLRSIREGGNSPFRLVYQPTGPAAKPPPKRT